MDMELQGFYRQGDAPVLLDLYLKGFPINDTLKSGK